MCQRDAVRINLQHHDKSCINKLFDDATYSAQIPIPDICSEFHVYIAPIREYIITGKETLAGLSPDMDLVHFFLIELANRQN